MHKEKLQDQEYSQALIAHRNVLIQSGFEISDQFTNRIFWLNAGGLTTCYFILDRIKPVLDLKIFYASVFFLISIILALIQYIFAQCATQLEIRRTDKQIKSPDKEIPRKRNTFNDFSIASILISFIFLISGIVEVILFIFPYFKNG